MWLGQHPGHRHVRGLQVVEVDAVVVEPLAVRLLTGDLVLDLLVLDDPALLEVDEEDLARLQPAEALDVLRVDRQHPGLGAEHDEAVLGLDPATGTQAVAVERRADDPPVGEADRRPARPTAPSGRSGRRRSPSAPSERSARSR